MMRSVIKGFIFFFLGGLGAGFLHAQRKMVESGQEPEFQMALMIGLFVGFWFGVVGAIIGLMVRQKE